MKTAEISAHYIDHMGSDLLVANAARTSFGKESSWDWDGIDRSLVGLPPFGTYNGAGHLQVLKPADASLIRFLASGYRASEWDALLEEIMGVAQRYDRAAAKATLTGILQGYKNKAQHWAPFAHPQLSLRMKLPLFLARQFVKHQIGATWSEESRRYMSSEPEFWFPANWHKRPEDIKQGACGLVEDQAAADEVSQSVTQIALDAYNAMLGQGVAPEEARTCLTLNAMTTVTWTGSLLFWSRVANQRLDGHAQLAAQALAREIAEIVAPRFPVSWPALVG